MFFLSNNQLVDLRFNSTRSEIIGNIIKRHGDWGNYFNKFGGADEKLSAIMIIIMILIINIALICVCIFLAQCIRKSCKKQ